MRANVALAGLLALIAASVAVATVPVVPTPLPPAAQEIVTGEDANLRMTVPVMINGKGPFHFVIDTGADRTVISRELADTLGLPAGRKTRLNSIGGASEVSTVKIDSLQVSTNINRNIKAAALSARDLGADGLLGVDTLKGLRITLDFDRKLMIAEPADAPPPPRIRDGDEIVVIARSRLGQLVMVDADADGQTIMVIVDTGAQNTIGNMKLRRTLVKTQRVKSLQPVTMIDVLGKPTVADYATVARVRVGGIRIDNAAVAFADVHPFKLFGLSGKPAMLLGMESLRYFRRVTIDFEKRRITFILPRKKG